MVFCYLFYSSAYFYILDRITITRILCLHAEGTVQNSGDPLGAGSPRAAERRRDPERRPGLRGAAGAVAAARGLDPR